MDIERLREMAGCTSTCALEVGEMPSAPILKVVHNGVGFSRQTAVDMYLLRTAEEAVTTTLAAWLSAHHRGDATSPFRHELSRGLFVDVPEWEEA